MTEEEIVHVTGDQEIRGIKVVVPHKFEVGKKYFDAVGRRWKIVKEVTVGYSHRVFLVRRWFRVEIAALDTPDRMTILFNNGFTTLYAEEESE